MTSLLYRFFLTTISFGKGCPGSAELLLQVSFVTVILSRHLKITRAGQHVSQSSQSVQPIIRVTARNAFRRTPTRQTIASVIVVTSFDKSAPQLIAPSFRVII